MILSKHRYRPGKVKTQLKAMPQQIIQILDPPTDPCKPVTPEPPLGKVPRTDKLIIGGAIRISRYDIERKCIGAVFADAVRDLSSKCDHIFIYANKLSDSEVRHFLAGADNVSGVLCDDDDQKEGWQYDNNINLEKMRMSVTEPVDWLLFPDSDEELPSNVRDITALAESGGKLALEFPIVECFLSKTTIASTLVVKILPHCLGVRWHDDLSFAKSTGFNKPSSVPDSFRLYHHEEKPVYHMRYSSLELYRRRKQIGYYEHFTRLVPVVPRNDLWTYRDYQNKSRERGLPCLTVPD